MNTDRMSAATPNARPGRFPARRYALQTTLAAALLVLSPGLAPLPGSADPGREAAPALMTDPQTVYSVPSTALPVYLTGVPDPTFGSTVTRIANDPAASTSPVSGTWGSDTRHKYSKSQPWSSDGSLIVIENRSGGSPSVLFLDGTTYRPRFAACSGASLYDYRWHPSKAHPHELINVDATGTQLSWYDVVSCTRTRSWTLPIAVNYGIGSGEGNPSATGRFVALGTATDMFVVDMDPQPPFAPYPNVRIGPVYHLPPESLFVSSPATWALDNLSISPSGRYVDYKFEGTTDTTYDAHRIFEVDSVTLALKPHRMASSSLRCGSFSARPNGWIFPLKHADMALDPYDHNEDVIIGGRACPGSSIGRVVKVRLRDGTVTALTDPTNESSIYHVSTRNVDRPGWAYVNYFRVPGKRFSDEIIAVKLDGSRQVERLAHTHTNASGCYRCESHPAPSRDGSRVIFASNWAQDCAPCGSATIIKDYVVSQTSAVAVDNPPQVSPNPARQVAFERLWPTPSGRLPRVSYVLGLATPAQLDLVDVAGRTILHHDLHVTGPGRFEIDLANEATPPTGIYWLRLRQEGVPAASSRVLIVR